MSTRRQKHRIAAWLALAAAALLPAAWPMTAAHAQDPQEADATASAPLSADQLDDLDVENFPTILIEDTHTARFFGTVLPHAAIVERMLSDLSAVPGAPHAPKLRNILAVEA